MANQDQVYHRAAGIDISKSDAKVCVRTLKEGHVRYTQITKVFGSTMAEIRALRAWLIDEQIESVVMESTSAYWKSFYDGLTGAGFEVVLANATRVKQLKGRKTDISDAAWLAKLACLDMAPPSFVPPRQIRDLRLMTRARVKLVQRRTATTTSLEKMLEDTGMKLSAVSSKLLTVSGRNILEAVCRGCVDPVELAKLSRLRKTSGSDLVDALEACIRPGHVVLIRSYLDQIDFLDSQIEIMDKVIAEAVAPYKKQIDLLIAIPGIEEVLARTIIGEIGVDMSVFPTPSHLAAWAGLAPGSNESAGKSRHAKTRKGNKYLKASMSQAARSAVKRQDTFFHARFQRICVRQGKAKAYTATAHSMLNAIWAMLTKHELYQDHGADFYTRTATPARQARLQANAEAQLTRLGVKYVILKPVNHL